MRSIEAQRTNLLERHDLWAQRVEARTSSHTPAARRASPVLTPRQRDVAALLVGTGLSYKQIAAQLDLSEGTIRTHTERIYRAFGVHSRAELTVALLALGNVPTLSAARPNELGVRSTRYGE